MAEHASKSRIKKKKDEDKAWRKEKKIRKEALKTRSDHKKEAKTELHKWIRTVRDKDLPCISCGNPNPLMTSWGQWDAGHYRSVGAMIELEFEPLNIAKQCKRCNAGNRLSGNPIGFRNGLIERHTKGVARFKNGLELVEWLDGPHPKTNYTIDDFKAIKAKYKLLLKQAKIRN
jgi:hypothetical protein